MTFGLVSRFIFRVLTGIQDQIRLQLHCSRPVFAGQLHVFEGLATFKEREGLEPPTCI